MQFVRFGWQRGVNYLAVWLGFGAVTDTANSLITDCNGQPITGLLP